MIVLKRFSRRTIEVADFYVKGNISDTKIATMGSARFNVTTECVSYTRTNSPLD